MEVQIKKMKMKTTKTTKLYRKTVANNIERIGNKFRGRITKNGTRVSKYFETLHLARTWVNKNTCS